MTADQLATNLRKLLPHRFIISKHPDHPHLFAGPDLLIGGEGKLCGLFLAKKSEASDRLLARLIASRLAMPTNMRWAVVVDPRNPDTKATEGKFAQSLAFDKPQTDFERTVAVHFQEISAKPLEGLYSSSMSSEPPTSQAGACRPFDQRLTEGKKI